MPNDITRQIKTMRKVTSDLENDSQNPTSKFSQIIFDGESAVSTAVNLNLFLKRYFLEKKWQFLDFNFHLAFLISQGSSKTTKAYICFKSS